MKNRFSGAQTAALLFISKRSYFPDDARWRGAVSDGSGKPAGELID